MPTTVSGSPGCVAPVSLGDAVVGVALLVFSRWCLEGAPAAGLSVSMVLYKLPHGVRLVSAWLPPVFALGGPPVVIGEDVGLSWVLIACRVVIFGCPIMDGRE